MSITLYGFWRSLASFRVRAVLNLKGLTFAEVPVDLFKGEHFSADFSQKNPQHLLPALDHNGLMLTQSLPIIEYLDETCTPAGQAPLLPLDAAGRARVRGMALIHAADAHPLVTPRVRGYLSSEHGVDEAGQLKWAQHWVAQGSEALEAHLAQSPAGAYAHGDQLTLADIGIVSHVVGARLFKADLSGQPRLVALADRLLALEPIARAHPLAQPGAPK